MREQKKIRSLVLVCLVVFSGFFVYFLVLTVNNYVNGVSEANAFKEEVRIEMVSITASDGAQINSFFLVSHENWEKTDRSVPLVIGCHGMGGGPLSHMKNLAYTLVKRGFAVLLPEDRGHEASDVPTTFGSKEPGDIIGLIDHIENNDKFNCVNVSNSGVIGTSLGGLMGMSTYIFESLGKGRLKAIAIGAGPVNITRAVELFTETPDALGDTPFLGNLTDKNPINYINATFPSNVLIRHGTADTTVDFNCSTDFMAILDPDGTRPDIEFHIKYGAGHEVAGNGETLINAISWVENYTIHAYSSSYTNVSDVEILNFDGFSTRHIKDFIINFQVTCVLLIFIIPLSVYIVKPKIFETKKDKEIENESIERDGLHERKPPKKQEKIKVVVIFLGIQGIALLITLFLVRDDIITELMIPAVLSMVFVLYLYHYKFPNKTREWCKQSFNPKVGGLFIISTVISMTIYHIVPNIPIIEESMLFYGVRITWMFPYIIVLITISFMTNVFLIRYLLSDLNFRKIRLLEPILNGLFMLVSVSISLYWNLDANLFGIPMALIVVIAVLIVFSVIDIIGQISEIALKTMVIVPIFVSLLVVLVVLSNYDIFYFL